MVEKNLLNLYTDALESDPISPKELAAYRDKINIPKPLEKIGKDDIVKTIPNDSYEARKMKIEKNVPQKELSNSRFLALLATPLISGSVAAYLGWGLNEVVNYADKSMVADFARAALNVFGVYTGVAAGFGVGAILANYLLLSEPQNQKWNQKMNKIKT